MDDVQEAFTRRMLRRVSSKKDRDGVLDTSNEDLQRRYNILKAIDEPCSTHRGSFTSVEGYQKLLNQSGDFSSKHLNWTRNSCNNNNENSFNSSYEKYDQSIERLSTFPNGVSPDYMKSFELSNVKGEGENNCEKIDDYLDNDLLLIDDVKVDKAQLLKVREGNIEIPTKMIAELANIENNEYSENRPSNENKLPNLTKSSMTSLEAAIEDIDEQIKNLEMGNSPKKFSTTAIVETPEERIYPILEDIKFDSTGYTPQREFFKKSQKIVTEKTANCMENNDENYNEKSKYCENFIKENISEDDGLLYQETPRLVRKMPIMESTRKSSHSDSTKIKFPTPMRVDPNSISTIGPLATPDRPDCEFIEGIDEIRETGAFLNDTIPYDVERFLEDALGDELYNTTITYATSEPRDRTNSHFTASELISEDRTPLHRRVLQAIKSPMTEPKPRNSNTLNRSMGIYRSLSQRIKKKFRSGLKTKEYEPSAPTLPSGTCETDRIRELLQEVNVQQTLMNQATKALNLCHTMKEFMDSSERIESERLLLLSSLRRKSVVEEIKRITSDEGEYEKPFYGEKSEITINNMSLNLRDCIQRLSHQNDETIEWFVIIVSQGLRVWATRATSFSRSKDSRIFFPGTISITGLTPNFKILVEIYSLKLRRSIYNHEDKYRIRNKKQKRSSSCPPCPSILVSPTKLLKKVERPLSPKIHYSHQASRIKNTSFVLSGFVELFLHDLSLSSPWPLMLVPANSILQGTIDLNLACKLHLSISHEGFLNHGDEAGGFAIWNRRWCVLKGHTLMFWNYPREQETKEPITIVELINCVSRKIKTADRTICAKPRTLLIETARRRSNNDRNSMIVECRTSACTIVRNLISFDSVHELMEWSTKLNHVIMALREWNVIDMRTETQVSDL